MVANDHFGSCYADFLDGQYDCVDRIILNAYFGMGCRPGGFRTWWRPTVCRPSGGVECHRPARPRLVVAALSIRQPNA